MNFQHTLKLTILKGMFNSLFRFEIVINRIVLFSMRSVIDGNSAHWLSTQWVAAGRPEIQRSEWDALVEKVGVMTERDVMD